MAMTDSICAISSHSSVQARSYQILEQELGNAKAEQGFIGKAWNGFKEIFDVGQSAKDCDNMLEKYQNGQVSFAEAIQYIQDFKDKQKTMTELFSNVATGIGSIAIATGIVAGGPIGWSAAFTLGAPVGAVLKTGINILDRATNDIKNDEFDDKLIAKDMISGAITGTTSAVASGVGAGVKAGEIGLAIKNGVKCGAQCGAFAGSTNYLNNVVFGDEKFSFGNLVGNTIASTAVSGTVGGVVGAGIYGVSSISGSVGKDVSKSVSQVIVQDSASSSSRKFLGQIERDITGIAISTAANNALKNANYPSCA